MRDIILFHLLHKPMERQQLDLIQALANRTPTTLEFSITYYSFGDLRISVEVAIARPGKKKVIDWSMCRDIWGSVMSIRKAAEWCMRLTPSDSSMSIVAYPSIPFQR